MGIVGYVWAAPATVIGLALACIAALTGGVIGTRQGVVIAHGGFPRWLLRRGSAGAMALGHVILARDEQCLSRSFTHEMHHVGQFARWGVFTLPIYWAIALWLRLRGLDAYLDHPMEPPIEEPR